MECLQTSRAWLQANDMFSPSPQSIPRHTTPVPSRVLSQDHAPDLGPKLKLVAAISGRTREVSYSSSFNLIRPEPPPQSNQEGSQAELSNLPTFLSSRPLSNDGYTRAVAYGGVKIFEIATNNDEFYLYSGLPSFGRFCMGCVVGL